MRGKKKVTEKQVAANGENSKSSTGPRTERGKNASKFNALTLGLFAKHIVIPEVDGDGCEAEFAQLVVDLDQEYQPQGPSEEFWVAQMVEGMWVLRRVTRAEQSWVRNATLWEGTPPNPSALAEVSTTVRTLLKEAQEEIKTTGTLSPGAYAATLAHLKLERKDKAQVEIDDQFLASLDERLRKLDEAVSHWSLIAEVMKENYYAAHALPPEAAMNSILRCERRAQKKLDWALQRLLESQRRRQQAQKP